MEGGFDAVSEGDTFCTFLALDTAVEIGSNPVIAVYSHGTPPASLATEDAAIEVGRTLLTMLNIARQLGASKIVDSDLETGPSANDGKSLMHARASVLTTTAEHLAHLAVAVVAHGSAASLHACELCILLLESLIPSNSHMEPKHLIKGMNKTTCAVRALKGAMGFAFTGQLSRHTIASAAGLSGLPRAFVSEWARQCCLEQLNHACASYFSSTVAVCNPPFLPLGGAIAFDGNVIESTLPPATSSMLLLCGRSMHYTRESDVMVSQFACSCKKWSSGNCLCVFATCFCQENQSGGMQSTRLELLVLLQPSDASYDLTSAHEHDVVDPDVLAESMQILRCNGFIERFIADAVERTPPQLCNFDSSVLYNVASPATQPFSGNTTITASDAATDVSLSTPVKGDSSRNLATTYTPSSTSSSLFSSSPATFSSFNVGTDHLATELKFAPGVFGGCESPLRVTPQEAAVVPKSPVIHSSSGVLECVSQIVSVSDHSAAILLPKTTSLQPSLSPEQLHSDTLSSLAFSRSLLRPGETACQCSGVLESHAVTMSQDFLGSRADLVCIDTRKAEKPNAKTILRMRQRIHMSAQALVQAILP